jgi:hypothetical protein
MWNQHRTEIYGFGNFKKFIKFIKKKLGLGINFWFCFGLVRIGAELDLIFRN